MGQQCFISTSAIDSISQQALSISFSWLVRYGSATLQGALSYTREKCNFCLKLHGEAVMHISNEMYLLC